MRLGLEPRVLAPASCTRESQALSRWYDSQPEVRRLWAIRESRRLRVIVSVEATNDNSDTGPVWLARCDAWARELRMGVDGMLELELFDAGAFDGFEIEEGARVIADLFWRDPTLA